ncbi:MAG: LCP family protein [Firmicutes bacterium]|nr:LCP family protein [Bacillota bacterium]
MRAERRREIEQQMAEEKTTTKGNALFIVIAVLYILAAIAFMYFVFKLDVLPSNYLLAGIALLAIITLFTVPVMMSKKGKHGRKIAATVVALIMIICFGVGTYYLSSTSDFLDDITNKKEKIPTESFYVLVRAADKPTYETVKDKLPEDVTEEDFKIDDEVRALVINGNTVGTFTTNDQMYSKAKIMLQEAFTVEYAYDESVNVCLDKLLSGEYNFILMPAASYKAFKAEETYNIKDDTYILYKVKVPKETVDHTKAVNVTKDPFNVYVSGSDQEGVRSDVNMILTINPVKHEVLLTSVPRDFYVTLPSKEAKDKLTHGGLYGVEELMGALENEFGIDLNYYVKVNYRALRKVVDAIGGIDVESQYDFYTSGMGRLDNTHFVVGMNHMDGDMALAFCRERHSFMSGDMTRNENQQAVLEAIIKKCTSSSTIMTSYTSILDAVSGNLETDMSADEISDLVKMQLKDMPSWKIKKNAIKGTTGSDYCYSLGAYASVVYSLPDEVTKAVDKIVKTQMMEEFADDESEGESTEENAGETAENTGK